MATESIRVIRMTQPVVTRILKQFRDERLASVPLDITGYTIKLIVKNALSDDDARALFDLAATLVTAAGGVYRFTFTTAHTCLPAATYPGQIRWWSGGATVAPTDSQDVDFVVVEAARKYHS